jgi:hypothetical protein
MTEGSASGPPPPRARRRRKGASVPNEDTNFARAVKAALRAVNGKEGTEPIPPVPVSIATPAPKRKRARLVFPIKGSSYSAIHRHAGAPLRILKAVLRTDPE